MMITVITISLPQSAVCRRRLAPRGGGLRGGGSAGGRLGGGGSEGGGLRGGGPVPLLRGGGGEGGGLRGELYVRTVTVQSVVPLHGPSLELCRISVRVSESEVVCICNWVESLTLISIVVLALSSSDVASETAA